MFRKSLKRFAILVQYKALLVKNYFLKKPLREKNSLTLVSMVKNEREVIESFCAHALSLFDRVVIIDHLSSDGTREFLALLSEKLPNLECYFFEDAGYYQSELMTWAAKSILAPKTAGWLFFLDADEFLPFRTREEFDLALSHLRAFPIISMPWLNLVPLDWENTEVDCRHYLRPHKPSRFRKIAFQPSLLDGADFVVGQGNHAVTLKKRRKKKLFSERAFPIYHVPIRTKQQFQQKILKGLQGDNQKINTHDARDAVHWREMHKIIQSESLTNGLMMGVTSRYSERLTPPYEKEMDELLAEGYEKFWLELGRCSLPVKFDPKAQNTIQFMGDDGTHIQFSEACFSGKKKIRFCIQTESVYVADD